MNRLTNLALVACACVAACSPPSAASNKPKPASSAAPNADQGNGDDPSSAATPERNDDKDGPAVPGAGTGKTPSSTSPAAPAGPLPPLTPRCATRLSIGLTGKSPSAALLASTDLAGAVDSLVGSADFAEQYARFVNSQFNEAPATSANTDPVYFLAKHVITNDKPWTDLFTGPYGLRATSDGMTVTNDANGLGYFRTDAWRKRYAGNEPKGIMLVGAFRILQNTTGLELTASVGNPGDDRGETGRKAAACKTCHFDSWFALDKVASLLPTKVGQDDSVTFTPPTGGAAQLFGKSIADDKALLAALVDSDGWRFQQCRTVFKFMYGRAENTCEAQTFDRCVDALTQKKTIRAAVAAVAKDPAVCR
jgi:hypothetical protein